MAENVSITPGSGAVIAADLVNDSTLGQSYVQVMKMMDGNIGGTSKKTVNQDGSSNEALRSQDIFNKILHELICIRLALTQIACEGGKAKPWDFDPEGLLSGDTVIDNGNELVF